MMTTTYTHIACIPSHDFDAQPTTLFDAQRDCRHRTASSMKPITLYVFLPLFFFSFLFLSFACPTGRAGLEVPKHA